jgi:hypothetical protein
MFAIDMTAIATFKWPKDPSNGKKIHLHVTCFSNMPKITRDNFKVTQTLGNSFDQMSGGP